MRSLIATCALLAATGCASVSDGAPAEVPAPGGWRAVATAADRGRLRDWRQAWVAGLRQANASDHRAAVAAEGVLLRPDTALPGVALLPGEYRCRVIKLGSPGGGELPYVAYPTFRCRVDERGVADDFIKLTGSQRPVGALYSDSDTRMVFLGTLVLGDEALPVRYGSDRERDLIAVVERIGTARWRMVFPYPRFESLVDVIELTPA